MIFFGLCGDLASTYARGLCRACDELIGGGISNVRFQRKDLIIYGGGHSTNHGFYDVCDNLFVVGNPLKMEVSCASHDSYTNLAEEYSNNHYGTFLAFTVHNGFLIIVRDPVGQLPIFYRRISKNLLCFSNEIKFICNVLDVEVTYNWRYLHMNLLQTFMTSEDTPFEDYFEIPHGCKAIINLNSLELITSINWDPEKFCGDDVPLEGNQKIVSTVESVVSNTLKNSLNILLDFSGGIDSSALLLCLSEMFNCQNIYAINMYHPDIRSSDERFYAKRLCKALNVNFIEFDYSKNPIMEPVSKDFYLKPNWPTSNLTHLKSENDIFRLSANLNIDTYLSGHGGDHSFFVFATSRISFRFFVCYGF